MGLARRILALIDWFDPVMQEWKRQDRLNARSHQLYRIGFTFNQKEGRVNEAIPGWMVNNESQRTGKGGGTSGAGETEAQGTLARTGFRKRSDPDSLA